MTESDFSAYSWVADYPETLEEEQEQQKEPFRCFCGSEVTAYTPNWLRCTCGRCFYREELQIPESNSFNEQEFARVNYRKNDWRLINHA